jgi:putative ABC transport system permease protein
MATLTSAFTDLFNDKEAFSGGFDIRATTLAVNPVPDMQAAIQDAEGLDADNFTSVANQSVLDLELRQVGYESNEFESYPVHGFDDEFLAENTYELALIAEGYDSAREVWQALADNPNLAVIDPIPVPRRDNFNFQAGVPEFRLEGFFFEDEEFTPDEVTVQDPQTGEVDTMTIIGVLKDTFPFFMLGLGTSQQTLQNSFDTDVVPTVHFFNVAEGVDAGDAAERLEAAFVQNGMEAESLEELLEEQVATSLTFNYILQGFMGLGLVVGVAALGVISARSVVERRQQIGVLRAIGFKQRMVQLSFLVESSFVALLGMAVGTLLGLIISFNIILDSAGQESGEGLGFAVPWLNLLIIFIITYLAALITSYFPARQASKVYPAEALRYE